MRTFDALQEEIDQLMDLDESGLFTWCRHGHVNMAGIDPVELASVYASRIVEFHLKTASWKIVAVQKGQYRNAKVTPTKEAHLLRIGKGE
jgi:sugar phosphate isomerase/epimerase